VNAGTALTTITRAEAMMAETDTTALPPEDNLAQETDLGSITFRNALAIFLESRKPFIGSRTYRDYEYYSKSLNVAFGHLHPNEITALQIRRYQIARRERCGPARVNQECSLVQQLLKRIGTWERVGLGYQPLPLPKHSPGRAISDEEEKQLLRAGASNPQWEIAYFFALLSLNTTMGPGEILTLRRKDIDLEKRTLTINPEGAKNRGRIRLLPLNEIAFRVCTEALARAEKKGSTLPEHYVFPFRVHGNYKKDICDPTRHCKSFKTAWTGMLKVSGISRLRPYDLRHTAITRLCENPENSEETVEAIAGHITHEMKKN
jgi:integrase